MDSNINDVADSAKIAVPLIAPFISALIDTKLKPKWAKFFAEQDADGEILAHSLESRLQEYLERAYERYSYMTTVVFQNQRKLLKDLYLPLHVQTVLGHGTEKNPATKLELKIDTYREDFLPKYERVLLTDTAGMGKSTLLRFLFLKCLEENAGIPILIDLRHLSKDKTVLDILFQELKPIDADINADFILKLVTRGDFVFFFDGYDEIATDQRPFVTQNLQDFVSKAGKNLYILSSRPEQALASFNNFQNFTIRPLEIEEAYSLIRLYAGGNPLSKQLIAKLEEPTSRNVHEFLTNPFLVSLLFVSYEHKPTLPLKKAIFYRQVYDALYDAHDLTKGDSFVRQKHSGLDSDDFHRILRSLGFMMFQKETVSADKDAWLNFIKQATERCSGPIFTPSDFLTDLTTTVPLVIREGEDYKWSHKSILEYFAALFVCQDSKEKQPALLRRFVARENILRCYNLLDLCYDLDYKTFQNTIIYDLISEFIEFYQKHSPTTPATEELPDKLEYRRRLCFLNEYVFYMSSYWNANFSELTDEEGHDKFQKLFELAFDKGQLSRPEVEITYSVESQVSYGSWLSFTDTDVQILALLWEKGNPVVEYPKKYPLRIQFSEEPSLQSALEKASVDGIFEVNKKLDVSCSSPAEIELIDRALADISSYEDIPSLCLKFKEAVALKAVIEQDLAREQQDDLLDGF